MLLPKFAILELNSQSDILVNLQAIEQGVQLASKNHAKFVILPENAFCFGNQMYASQFFEPLKAWCGQLAQQYGIYFLAGTLPCPYRPNGSKVADGKLRQSSLLFDPSGDCVARYDKIHLFKATVNDSTGNYDEGKTFEAGDTPVVAKTAFGDIGMMVCFDLRFPTLAIKLRQMGADILTAPSAFTYQTGKAHWQVLLTARALDSQCLVIGAGQSGDHHFVNQQKQLTTRQTWGHSQFLNANGKLVGEVLSDFADIERLSEETPLIREAKNWLKPADNAELLPRTSSLTILKRLLMTNFDQGFQNECRNAINLAQSHRFNIISPAKPSA